MQRTPLYQVVYDGIKAGIESGELSSDGQIPPEHVLMERFGVSRVTTNRALRQLALEGVIVRQAGRGSFVAESPKAQGDPGLPHGPRSASIPAIGFVLPFLGQSFGAPMIRYLEELFSQQQLSLVVACSYGQQSNEEAAINRLSHLGVKGVIVLPVNGEFYDPAILKLHVEKVPLVLVDKSLAGLPVLSVTTDNRTAAKRLTEHLLGRGHRDIAFYSPNPAVTSTLRDRLMGFHDAYINRGMVPHPHHLLVSTGSEKESDAIDRIVKFLNQHPKIDAVFAVDDELAEHWVLAAKSLGRRVPEEMAIVTFDAPPATLIDKALAIAVQDQRGMAEEAARLLTQQMAHHQDDSLESVLLPAEILINAACSETRRVM